MRCVAFVLVVISGYLLLDIPHVYHAKTLSFCSFSDKNFAADPKIEQSQNTKSMVFATLSQKCYHKTRTKNIGKRKPRNVVLLTKTSQNTGFSCFRPKNLPNINDTPRTAADARASLLLFLFSIFLLLLLLLWWSWWRWWSLLDLNECIFSSCCQHWGDVGAARDSADNSVAAAVEATVMPAAGAGPAQSPSGPAKSADLATTFKVAPLRLPLLLWFFFVFMIHVS